MAASAGHLAWVDRIREVSGRRVDDRALRIALLEEIRRRVPFDAYAWLLTDPDTEVGAAPLADVPAVSDLRAELPALIRAKYLTTVNRWTSAEQPVSTLVGSTGGARERSFVWRDVLAHLDVVDVASVVFRDGYGCWGWMDLWRIHSSPFSVEEQADLTAIVAPITEAIRRCQARTFEHDPIPLQRTGPAVLVLSPALDVRAQTAETDAYLRTLVPPDGDRPIPAAAYNVAAQLLAVEAGIDTHEPVARVHLGAGTWMSLRAARAGGATDAEPDIAVTIEPTSPSERLSLFARCHGLTARETELVDQLAAGADTRTVAASLFLSKHTVQDHLKSIFAKTGARNRRTLLSRVAGL